MARLGISRETLAGMLRQHNEDDLARRALRVTDDELARIGTLGAYYAFSKDAMELGGSMGGTRALSLAALDVLENTGRDLHLSRTEAELGSSPALCAEDDAVRDRELRRHAAREQIPADESKRTLDTIDPPAWSPAAANATAEVKRCHELRTKPLIDFTRDDLRFLIDQGVALDWLIPLAIDRLRQDTQASRDHYRADLLASVLRVDGAWWERFVDPDVEFGKIAENLFRRFELEPGVPELVEVFMRDRADRRRRFHREPLD